jgi:hypothetical protein
MSFPAKLLQTPFLDDHGRITRPWAEYLQQLDKSVSNIQSERVTTGIIAAGARVTVTLTWAKTFTDTSYSVTASVTDTSAAGPGLRVERVTGKTATTISVQLINDSAGALTGTLEAVAVHD